ncbi:hypothetical protein BaRGS_00008102, partial [Batillaria attramentaria]
MYLTSGKEALTPCDIYASCHSPTMERILPHNQSFFTNILAADDNPSLNDNPVS